MKYFLVLWSLVLLLCSSPVMADNFDTRDGNVVTQGNETITFTRQSIKWGENFVAELQYVQKPNTTPYAVLHIWGLEQYDAVEIVSPSGKSIVLTQDPSLTVKQVNAQIDKWYPVDVNALLALDNPDKCKVILHRPKNKTFTFSAKKMLQQLRQVTGHLQVGEQAKDLQPYGAVYSVFFPNTPADKVRDAMAYYLNRRMDSTQEKIYRRGNTNYMLPADLPIMLFWAQNQLGQGVAQFKEVSGGTWLDLDFWVNRYTQNGYTEGTYADDEVINIGMNAAEQAYKALVPHSDYGLTLNGGLNKNGPTIDTIDVKKHPELAKVSHNDAIISINGVAMEKAKNYIASYMLTYGHKPLALVLKNSQNQQYTVTVQPKAEAPGAPNADFKGALAKEKNLQINEKYFMREWPQTMPVFERFDPASGDGTHVDSPLTGPLDKALQ